MRIFLFTLCIVISSLTCSAQSFNFKDLIGTRWGICSLAQRNMQDEAYRYRQGVDTDCNMEKATAMDKTLVDEGQCNGNILL